MRTAWLTATIFMAAACLISGCTAPTPLTESPRAAGASPSTSEPAASATTQPSPSLAISTSPPGLGAASTTHRTHHSTASSVPAITAQPSTHHSTASSVPSITAQPSTHHSTASSVPAITAQPSSSPRISITTSSRASPTSASSQMATPGIAATLTQLAALPVKGRAPKTGYTRAQFGEAWTDNNNASGGHNGCDTRNDILRRDLIDLVIKPGSNGCSVLSGTLHDPYTATSISFTRGVATSTQVQIDHMVALSDAWQTGAQQLSTEQRIDLANDPRNLQAVDGPTNEAKSDSDAASWLPPNKSYRCTYVARQIQVKTSYHLWVTAAEKVAMQQQLMHCSPGATTTSAATVASRTSPSPATTSTSTPTSTTTAPPAALTTSSAPPPPTADVYYKNCTAVRAAGRAPLLAGEPGYRAGLDRDHDGIACET